MDTDRARSALGRECPYTLTFEPHVGRQCRRNSVRALRKRPWHLLLLAREHGDLGSGHVTESTIAAEALVTVLSLVFVMMGPLKVVAVVLSSE